MRAASNSVSRSRVASILLGFVSAVAVLSATAATLEQLTLSEMSDKSTEIVRGRVLGSTIQVLGNSIYTHYSVQVLNRWKGEAKQTVDVVLPGGQSNGLVQHFAGVPRLESGKDYVMFLWTGPSGRTQLTGLTQGLLDISQSDAGEALASRSVSAEMMLSHEGKIVQDQALRMRMADLDTFLKGSGQGKALR